MKHGGVPLAWLNLVHNRGRLVVSAAGIAFAVLLMFMQTGFRNAMFDGQAALITKLDADLIITNRLKFTLAFQEPFARRRLEQARAVPGVAEASSIYVEHEGALWRNPEGEGIYPIRVFAFDPSRCAFIDAEICRQAKLLELADAALFDRRSRDFYGRAAAGTQTELSRRAIRIAGGFTLGTDFLHDGNLIMSDTSFFKFFPDPRSADLRAGRIEMGLIRLAPGAALLDVKHRLDAFLPFDVAVMTKQEFVDKERAFWASNTPIGYVFDLGTAVGFLVGAIICYQILFTDVSHQLSQFGTLRAIGYYDSRVSTVVLEQALLLSVLGFIPGMLVSRGLYIWLSQLTGLPMHMAMLQVALVFGLTVTMCVAAGMIASRKALALDPADVY